MLRIFLIAVFLVSPVFASEPQPLQMHGFDETRSTEFVFPVIGTGSGANDSFWETTITLLNLSGAESNVVLAFFQASVEERTEPTRQVEPGRSSRSG